MSYNVHITKAKDWSMNDGCWISPEDWLAVVKKDSDLEIITELEPYLVAWLHDPSGIEIFYDWNKGNISTKNPTKEAIIKMEDIAMQLNANVQGDDGEYYKNGCHLNSDL